jgi:hypothetical protein
MRHIFELVLLFAGCWVAGSSAGTGLALLDARRKGIFEDPDIVTVAVGTLLSCGVAAVCIVHTPDPFGFLTAAVSFCLTFTVVVWMIALEEEDEGDNEGDNEGGGGPDDDPSGPPDSSWWPEFEQQFRSYSERQPALARR